MDTNTVTEQGLPFEVPAGEYGAFTSLDCAPGFERQFAIMGADLVEATLIRQGTYQTCPSTVFETLDRSVRFKLLV